MRKLYPYIFYSLKNQYSLNNRNISLYCYNNLKINIRESDAENTFKKEEIYSYLQLLNFIIKNEKFFSSEKNLIDKNYEIEDDEEKEYYSSSFLSNYIQLQLYTIICSLETFPKNDEDLILREVKSIIKNYQKNYYYKEIMLYHKENFFNSFFHVYTYDKNFEKVESQIYLQKIETFNTIKNTPIIKNIDDIKLTSNDSIFNYSDFEKKFFLEYNDNKDNKKFYSFLFEPFNLSKYLETCQLIYEKYS